MVGNPSRVLTIGHRRFRWRVFHTHGSDATCCECLAVWPEGRNHAGLFIDFRAGDGRLVPSGGFAPLERGRVVRLRPSRVELNLHEPGVVRALIDAAAAAGIEATSTPRVRTDGWSLIDAARERASSSRRG